LQNWIACQLGFGRFGLLERWRMIRLDWRVHVARFWQSRRRVKSLPLSDLHLFYASWWTPRGQVGHGWIHSFSLLFFSLYIYDNNILIYMYIIYT